MNSIQTFGQWIKQRRKALGLTQKELAQQAGCAEVTLRKIEAGDLQPSGQLAASLAAVAGVADADLPARVGFALDNGEGHAPAGRWSKPRRPHNLPAQLTPLLGRELDITAVRSHLREGARLITLLGPPGVGKTRLALAAAESVLDEFEHGVFFVRLAPVSNPDLVAATIVQALNASSSGPNPPALKLRAYLEEKHLLLVLDNFEQVIEAAPLVDGLLRRCSWLHVLVTSRQPLRVRGERQAPVRPLALPAELPGASQLTASDVLRYSAVALFAERAEMVQPDFAVTDGNAAVVAELCRRLDGLPLAIELVAARVRLLSPAELLARLHGPWMLSMDGLRDVSLRQKTLRNAIGWSYSMLTSTEQTLFTRLAVFVGGCTLAAAEMLCGDDATLSPSLPFCLSPPQVLDGIASLLDKSLLQRETSLHGEPRYVMLETVREYGLERVALSGHEAMLRQRHANCCLRMIEKAEQTDFSRFRMHLRRQIDSDIHNLRAAHSWAIEQDSQAALLIAVALVNWLGARGPFEERRLLIAATLASPGASAHTIPRAKMLFEAGLMLAHQDPDQAQAFQEESLALSQELGYVKGEADALTGLGRIGFSGLNDLSAAQRYLERALPIYRELHDLGGIAYATDRLAIIAFNRADYSLAAVLANECLAIAQQSGFLNSWALLILGNIAYAHGDLVEARSRWEQALVLMDSKGVMADTLAWMGVAASIQGDFPAAHAFLDESRSLWRSGHSEEYARVLVAPHTALLFQTKGDYENAVRWYRASLPGLEREVDTWVLCGLGLAALAAALDQHELAARMLGATDAVHQEDRRLHPFERDNHNRLADATRASLGAAAFAAAWMQGRACAFEQAIEEAVSILETALAVKGQPAPT